MKRILFSLLLLVIMTSCGKSEPSPSPSATPMPEPTVEVTADIASDTSVLEYDPLTCNPMTGLPVENPEQLQKRPVAIMMNNIKVALPMRGISQADVIYETLAEGGVTRMLAVYQDASAVKTIGSIRSTRTYYLELALGHDAILLHAGASYIAYDDIANWKVDHIDGVRGDSGNLYYRDSARIKSAGLEHSMFTDGERIASALERFSGRRDIEDFQLGWGYVTDAVPEEDSFENAENITVNFTSNKTTKFLYDAGKRVYFVEEFNKAFMDEAYDEQVNVTNVLTLSTDVKVIKGDSAGRLTTRLTGSGEGTFSCGGRSVPIIWSKEDRNSPFVFRLEDGSELALGRGKSYICIIPMEGKVTLSEGE